MANKNEIIKEFIAETDTVIIKIQGEFTYDIGREFREIYENVKAKPKRYVIDLSQTKYVDSAGLGMFVAFRDYIVSDGSNIHLVDAKDNVLETLELSNFEDLFSFTDPR